MLVTLKAGEHLWGTRGSHLCDEHGFAIVLLLDTDVEIDDDVAEAALAVICADREFRGLDSFTGEPLIEFTKLYPLTGEPLPEVEWVPEVIEPTPEVVPEVVPELTPIEGEATDV